MKLLSGHLTKFEKLKEQMTNLDRLNLVSEMAAGVAHEIRNPMTVIKGYLQFLGKSVPDSIREQFCIVLSELGRIESLITDFLSLAGNKIVENKEQNLNAIIEGIIPLIMADATERGIELRINLAEELPCLMLNAKEIKQLLLNLTRNGIEAMGQRGTLIIESIIESDTISLCVEDSGCGIRKENQEKIFDPFFTTKDDGTGLGLSVCAGIVRRNNGVIKVQSKQGRGTRFTITFNAVCVK
ncbi:MAG: sensor signal transduction histidine kinase [Massilibacillus sp.]|nr:sensor signal transduction histidine kinase [Massilibacillus sp.]